MIFNMFNMTIIFPNFKLIKLVQCMACELFMKNTCSVFFNWTNKCSVHMYLSNKGFLANGDGYTHRYDEITEDVKNIKRIVNDTLLNVHSTKLQSIWSL